MNKELLKKEQVLRIINSKLLQEEACLKNSTTDFRKRLFSHSVAILRDLKYMLENMQ